MHPTIFVIFGITGDLAARKLLPALLALYVKKKLPVRFSIIGFSRRSFSRDEFRELIRGRLNIKPGEYKEEDVKHFMDHMNYVQGMFDEPTAYERLAAHMHDIDDKWGQCSNKLFHLSVPPNMYEGILKNISHSKLNHPCSDGSGWTRLLVEKPFGSDLDTAKALDKTIGKLFKEEQIFRIDHYLAKEAMQNILAFRFANSMFEPLWNRQYIDKIHIKLFEEEGVGDRGDSYDGVGALKDVGQNHMLMMLATIAMGRPKSFGPDDIRKERADILSSLSIATGNSAKECSARSQYDGYALEVGVPRDSQTETYFRVKSFVNSARWKGVPMYLESGKAMAESKTEIDVYFKPHKKDAEQNILTFRIQPDEGIKIKFFVKTPGYDFSTEPKTLKFKYGEQLSSAWQEKLSDYERLIHDAFVGDQTLFASTKEILSSWKFVAAVIKSWNKIPLTMYKKGSSEIS